jgi:hypothetical protein
MVTVSARVHRMILARLLWSVRAACHHLRNAAPGEDRQARRTVAKSSRSPPGMVQLRLTDNLSTPCSLRGFILSLQRLLPTPIGRFLSTHKEPERKCSGTWWDLVPKAESTRCNVPDHCENYGF